MCRLAGYVGSEPVALSSLLYDPPHSLERMAYAPRELVDGTVNVDGTGVAWWPADASRPLRYVTDRPPWSDPNLPGLSPSLTGRTVLAAVRSATPGLPFGPASVAPFVSGGLAAVHNGWIGGFRGSVGRTLIARLSDERHAELVSMHDSLALFLLVAQHADAHPDAPLADAVAAAIQAAAAAVEAAGQAATLNLAVASPTGIVAARTSIGAPVNSLYVRTDGDGAWLASEPLDPAEVWERVPEHTLVTLSPGRIDVQRLSHAGVPR